MQRSGQRLASSFVLALSLLGEAAARAEEAPAARIERLEKILSNSPDNGGVMYRLAVVEARAGRHADAIRWLERAAATGYDFDITKEPAFAALRKFEPFQEVARRQAKPPTHTSAPAFRIPEPDLIPEGIAWDSVGGSFYVGSLYKKKIVRVGPEGAPRDFIASGQDGLWTVLGMKVDEKRRILWANSAADGREGKASGSSGLFAFDLATGRLLEKHALDGRSGKHLFNDLVLTPRGDVYLTDSEAGGIWRLARGGSSLEAFLPSGSFEYPNGIALDPGATKLYVADFVKAISIVDIATKQVRRLPHPRNVSIHEIDGLYLFRGSLVAIQNGPGLERVVQFRLDASGERVEAARVIESRNPDFQIPTTGAIAGGEFFYIANSQLENLGEDGRLKPGAKLQDVRILKAPLD
jgi:sugar lactone lactonase YvrE